MNRTWKGLYGFHPGAIVVLAVACVANGQAPAAATEQNANAAPPSLLAKFDGSVDTKSAKVGDPVTVKVKKELKLKDLTIPKSSRILGSVTAVQSMQEGNGTSSLAIKFDRVEMKGGEVLPIAGLILAIGPNSDEPGLGYNSVLGRGGVGSTPGLDPHLGGGAAVNRDDSKMQNGSTLPGVALGLRLNSNEATELRGVHLNIKLDSNVMVKIALYRPK